MATAPTRARNVQTPGGAPSAASASPAAAAAVEDASLPNAVDVDARFLRGPVLTRQGYVVPDEAWQKANQAEFQAAMKAQA